MFCDFRRIKMGVILILFYSTCFTGLSFSQTFMKVTDPSNPIVTANFATNYSGAAWIDFNNDGNLDLFTTKNFLFSGDGKGNFETITTDLGPELGGQSNGPSWGDYDNDGNIDCFIAANPSRLYRNEGNGVFTPILKGDIGPDADTRGWASSWADADNNEYK